MARDERRDPGEMYPGGKTYGKPGEAPDRAVSWKSVVDKPTTYPPEKHRHDTSEVDGLNASLEQFVRKVEGKGLSTCDYTQAEKKKLSGVEDGANKTIIDASLSTSSAAADAKAVGDKIEDCMTKVTTLKINDEWRFSVGPGISGEMAIRLEHLEFPSQGIWGIYTAMTIPTGLGALAKSADIPEISTTFTSADAGKAADAKAVGGKLAGKLNTNWSSDISFGWGESNADIGYRAEHYDNAILMTDASWGPYFIVRINGTNYTLTFPNQGGRVVLSDEDTNELPEPIKTALFAGADFIAAVKKYGGTQIKEDEKGFYYEVDEEA